jgi:AraC-like DNA-binding protein
MDSRMPSNTLRQIPRFDILTNLVRDEEGNGFSFGDFAVNVRSQPNRTLLHRHDYPELFFFYRGTGSHRNDFQDYSVRSPCLVFVDAGHVHAWPDAARLRGDMLSFDAGFALYGQSMEKTPALFLPPAPVVIPLQRTGAEAAQQLFSRIRHEWEKRGEGWLRAVRSCLHLLHVDAVRAHARMQAGPAPADNAATRLCREFLLLLEKNLHAATGPGKLAAGLGVSADHLSATLREATGKSAAQHIQDRLMLEARRLLAHSRLDVSEIAYHLGYADVSYFGRVFRRNQRMTPGEFRKRFLP